MTRIQPVSVPNTCGPVNAVGTTGTGVFTVWGNIAALSSKSTTLNPYAIENSASATDDIAYVFDVPKGYNWLDTYLAVLGASATVTGFKGVFFGKFPLLNAGEKQNASPRLQAIGNWTTALADPNQPGAGIWLPLDNPVSGDTEFTFPTSFTLTQDVTDASSGNYRNIGGLTGASISAHRVSSRTSVYVAGASRVMFLPTVVATLGGSGASGVLLGRFVV
jgi:hypothetical protein